MRGLEAEVADAGETLDSAGAFSLVTKEELFDSDRRAEDADGEEAGGAGSSANVFRHQREGAPCWATVSAGEECNEGEEFDG